MLKILIIGYSSLAQRRIIDTLQRNNISYDIASRSKVQKDLKADIWYKGYNEALNKSNADIAYISLPNTLHFTWGMKALKKGFHTIIDKPATINLKELNLLFATAKKNKKTLSEATFFNYHTQIKYILREIKKNKIKNINANFFIPKPNKKNILSSKKLGGGVIMDMGPYIAAVSRLFFKSNPKKKIKKVIFVNKIASKIEIKFTYRGSYFVGKFSHNDKYKNSMEICFNKKVVKLSRFFSPPALEKLKVLVFKGKMIKSKIFSDDVFKNYIEEVFRIINKKDYSFYQKRMLHDMKIREYLQDK